MKTLFLFLMIMPLLAGSMTPREFSDALIRSERMLIEEVTTTESGLEQVEARPPSYYDVELLVAATDELLKTVEKYEFIEYWRRSENSNSYSTIIDIADNIILILYNTRTNRIFFLFK